MARKKGFTVLEALIALVVLSLLVAVLYPAMAAAKQRAIIGTAVQRLRQIHIGIEIYRNEWDGSDVFTSYRSFYTLGLPVPEDPGYVQLPGVSPEVWRSPCASKPADWMICATTGFPGLCGGGIVSYVAHRYEPSIIDLPYADNANRSMYSDYLVTYRGNSVLVVDVHCNPPGTNMRAPFLKKRGLALLLNGSVVNKFAEGNAADLRWYSEPE